MKENGTWEPPSFTPAEGYKRSEEEREPVEKPDHQGRMTTHKAGRVMKESAGLFYGPQPGVLKYRLPFLF
ncbi:MAG: hypothetical protein M3Z08_01660 [Chloroflexota bacterium]|nr:hypothetical protein [Chloroflexota bacterium]